MVRGSTTALLAAVVLGTTIATTGGAGGAAAAPAQGRAAIIHAVPSATLTVSVDGEELEQDAEAGEILGPVRLSAGEHEVRFDDGAEPVTSTFVVEPGRSSDVVLHRPAVVGDTPVVSVYPKPVEPLGPGRARVVLAHTATTAPADVRVDGETVFTNIANGEFAQADLAAGPHRVALFPSGVDADPLLGPLEVTLEPGTLTSVYAVGNPSDGSMDVVVRTSAVGGAAVARPTAIDTGSAGLVGSLLVHTFTPSR